MLRYIAQRIIALVPILFGMSILAFLISHTVPGDPARAVAGLDAGPAQVEAVRQEYGLDKPLYQQYFIYMGKLLHGDLGMSIITSRPVSKDLLEYFPATLELALASIVIALAVGVPLGIIAAINRGTPVDHAARIVVMSGVAAPVFWSALFLQLIFYGKLGWLPAYGRLGLLDIPPPHITGLYTLDSLISLHWGTFVSAIKHLILPALALSQMSLSIVMRMVRSSVLEIIGEDFVRTAHAKGLRDPSVMIKHVLRNASLPVITILGLQFGQLLGGAVLTETIFSWPGIGSYAVRAVTGLDFPAIMGVAMLASAAYVIVNLLVDLGYALLDPRLRT